MASVLFRSYESKEQARLTVQRRKEGQELEPFSGCDTGYFSFVIGSLDIFTNK